ncbi:ABC transporter permease [Agromyces aerolatus]|uniref:ABC transporter permease n=1 Tax=Agromyces sp. LY-1074 TaxID=3074080 RepID=UPI0028601204|nr:MULTISPECIES: polyketide antibiotic transporter [unclassified Agromyces]MDR5701436.1 polyketide antibiotic transporter [Agromyces sp. LY-1074]MDR5706775.1 polyketide antibiotic transporter [Agromyces sp. LY-1358]
MSRLLVLLAQRLRRDRLQLTLWCVGVGVLAFAAANAALDAFGDVEERRQILGVAIASRTILVFRGLPNGVDEGAFVFFLLFAWLALMGGLMSTFLAVRHTRMEEEQGRAEFVASTPAGRALPTVATVVHGALANVVLGLFVAVGWILAGLDARGAFVAGAAIAASGIVFLALGLVVAQLFRTSRGANGAGVAIVLAAYLLRGIGDAAGTPSSDLIHVTPAWPSWVSPIGYGQFTGAFVDDDLRPLIVPLGFAALVIAGVFVLQAIRDQGASLLPERQGRAAARWTLSSSFGLVWRLTVPTLVAWAVGGAAAGLLATTLSSIVGQVGGAAPQLIDRLREAIGDDATIEQAFIATFYGLVGVLAACCAVQVGMRARQEEAHGTAELVLGTPVPRVRWLAEYWIVGTIVIVVVLAAAGATGVLGALRTDDPASLVPNVLEAAAAQLPACLVFLGVTLLVFVLLPQGTIPLGWTLVGLAAIVGIFGPILQLPDWVTDLSPFTHSPVPGSDDADWTGGIVMVAVGVVLGGAAVWSMRARELAPGG